MPILMSSGYVSDELLSEAKTCGLRELLSKENAYKDLPIAAGRLVGIKPMQGPSS